VPTNNNAMPVLIAYFVLLCVFLVGSSFYPSTYTKEDMDAWTLLLFRPFIQVMIMAVVFLIIAVNYFKKQGKNSQV
jgi:hypothetical protein